jgi:hypothetical protein
VGGVRMRLIHKIDFVVIFLSALGLIFLLGYMTPMVIYPIDDYSSSSGEVLFVIDRASVLFIDDNIDFTTPDEYYLKDGLRLHLNPGVYYWKVKGVFESEIRTLTINSEVSLQLREINENEYGVYNAGNVRLNVDVYNGTRLIEKKKLEVGREFESFGNKFIGGMDDE